MKTLIHPTAIIAKETHLGEGVAVGPYTIIGPHVKIGRGSTIASHAVIEGYTTIGENCRIFSGVRLGTEPQDKRYKKTESFLLIGNENTIREYVTMNSGSTEGSKTVVGHRNFIMIGAHIAHDCVLGDDITIANTVGLSGHVNVEDKAFIGGMAGVCQFARIGRLSMTGGLSKVNTDIPPFSICDGNPVRFYGLNSVGLKRAGYGSKESLEIKKALKTLFASRLNLLSAIKKVKETCKKNLDIDHLLDFVSKSERGIPRSVLKMDHKI